MTKNYLQMFERFFEKGSMSSTYKGAFLYALSDIRFYGDDELVGKEWIHPDGKQSKINLDFIAIRFARYYWEVIDSGIRHIPEKMADEKNPDRDVNIVGLIREMRKKMQSGHIPSLQELTREDMTEFRKDVITKSFKEPLDHLSPIFSGLFEIDKKRTIRIESDLMDFMKENNEYIHTRIGIKIQNHLEKINSRIRVVDGAISHDNPFYTYIKNQNSPSNQISEKNKDEYPDLDMLINDVPENVKIKIKKRLTAVRENQEKFRKIVLKNYHNKCAICGICESALLEASHIIPVRYEETSGDVDNGICLCSIHHKMFDNGYLYFDDEYGLKLTNKVESKYLYDSCVIQKITKSVCDILPSKKYLKRHKIILGLEK